MEFNVSVVPPGGGEQDYMITIRGAHYVPRPGEYIVVSQSEMDEEGIVSAFKVRYAITHADPVPGSDVHSARELWIEAEPIFHGHQSKSHRELCERYNVTEWFPASGY